MKSFTLLVETDEEIIESTTQAQTIGEAIKRIGNTLENCEFLYVGECFVNCARIYKVSIKETKQ